MRYSGPRAASLRVGLHLVRAVLLALAAALVLDAPDASAAEPREPASERRIALVIGNARSAFLQPSLPNPRNDAEDASAALQEAGFEVFAVTVPARSASATVSARLQA